MLGTVFVLYLGDLADLKLLTFSYFLFLRTVCFIQQLSANT